LPNSKKSEISKKYTSPMKLFEYMASGIPIVASDLPSIREILNESNSVLVDPDIPKSIINGIIEVITNKSLANKISEQSFLDVENYTWSKRAINILEFIR
jgi:glycosyltransferase involved in cell wall biosynthesis